MKRPSNIAAVMVAALLSASLCPTLVLADKGSGNGSGGSGGSGSSGSSGNSGSSGGTGSSGRSGSTGSSGDDHSGSSSGTSGDHGREASEHHPERQENVFQGGWRERLHAGQYEVLDPEGRLVIRRAPTEADLRRLH